MHIHWIQHVPFEGLGSIAAWIDAVEHRVSLSPMYEDPELPELAHIDWLIVMGGPMGVHDDGLFPWLKQEKQYIEKAIAKGKTVLGICLGAQLIAHVLGARVWRNPLKEIGWHPIHWTEQALESPQLRGLPPRMNVFHWHGDTFDLPAGAQHWAASQACTQQAFHLPPHVYGFQFHLETTPGSARELIQHCRPELDEPGVFIQTPETILNPRSRFGVANQTMAHILNRI